MKENKYNISDKNFRVMKYFIFLTCTTIANYAFLIFKNCAIVVSGLIQDLNIYCR